jgi:hypothetical protein
VTRPYKYTVDAAVLAVCAAATKRRREELLRIFDRLAADPYQEGDSTQPDDKGRHCQVKRFGPWTITWWPEHLANELHIVDAEWLR